LQGLLTDKHDSTHQLRQHGAGNSGYIVCMALHPGDPVVLEPKAFYILQHTSPSQQIRLIPWLHALRLAPKFINELLQEEQHDLSQWAQIFRTICVTLNQTSGLVSCASHEEH
jgi:hypothetical protein